VTADAGTQGSRDRAWSPAARTALLFGLLFLAALVLVVGRAARDALFLTRFPVTWIAPMWIVYAAGASVVAVGYGRLANRLARVPFVIGFSAIGAASFALLRWLIAADVSAAYAVLYVWSEIVANLGAVVAWTLAQDLSDARHAKRFFGWVGAGRVIGMTACGFATTWVVRAIGTLDLLWVLVGALVLFALLAVLLARGAPLPSPRRDGERAIEARLAEAPLARSRYVRVLAVTTLLLFAMLTVGDYQFKAIARSSYPDRDALASFLGLFYGVLGAASAALQVALTPLLLERVGVLAGLAAMPLCFTLASAGLWAWPTLLAAAVMKGCDNGLQFTVHESALQILFFPFSEEQRNRVRTAVAAAFKPIGYGLGGLVLMLVAPSGADATPGAALVTRAAALALYTVPLGLTVLVLLPFVRRGYLRAMGRTLVRGEQAAGVAAGSRQPARALLHDALHSGEPPRVLFALAELRTRDPATVVAALPALARHASPRVRALALAELHELDHPDAARIARAGLDDADVGVRCQAADAFAHAVHEDAIADLEALAETSERPVREAAIAALVRHCGLDGMLAGAPRLRAWIDSPAVDDRVSAARVLGIIGKSSLQRPLERLMRDPVAAVRRAALGACATVRNWRLLPTLVELCGERGLRGDAERALVALGPRAVDELRERLCDRSTPHPQRLALPRVLQRIEHPSAYAVLLGVIDDPNELVRHQVLTAASRLRKTLDLPREPVARVEPRILAELEQHDAIRDGYVSVRPLVARPLLEAHVLARLRRSLVRVLRLFELAYPRDTIASVRAHFLDPDPRLRANAFEVLDALVDRRLEQRFVQEVDRYLEMLGGRFPAPALGPREAYVATWIGDELESAVPYRMAVALEAAAHHGVTAVGPLAVAALDHLDPFVRETAALAVRRLEPAGGRERIEALAASDAALAALGARAHTARGEAPPRLYTTVEKVLFLQRVPVFGQVAGEDLVELGRGAAVLDLEAGEVVFREGEMGAALYLVLSGSVALAIAGRTIATLGPNEVFGEMSIFDREPRGVTATATAGTELLRVSAEDFQDAVRSSTELAIGVLRVLNQRLRKSDALLARAEARLGDRGEALREQADPARVSEPPASRDLD
jgi:CRP-like cAMP-binding protein/HEAT repeat protein